MAISLRRPRLAGVVVAAAFSTAVAGAAHAYPATWEFSGTVTEVESAPGAQWPADHTVGAPIRVLVSFDTEELFSPRASSPDPTSGEGRTGWRYESFGTQTLQMAVYIGADCNPCVPTNDPAATPNNLILVRDNWQNEALNAFPNASNPSIFAGPGEFDGYSFRTISGDNVVVSVVFRDLRASFSPEIVNVTGGPVTIDGVTGYQPMPVLPDSRLTSMLANSFEACFDRGNGNCLRAHFDTVSVPTYGTYFFLSGRHCQYPDFPTRPARAGFVGDDCTKASAGPQPVSVLSGGSAGWSDFSFTYSPQWESPLVPGQMDVLGTDFGAVAFGGPGGLPVLRGSSFPTDLGRTNSNLLAYQGYTFTGGAPTPLALVVDLGYSISSNWNASGRFYPDGVTEIQEGLRPGGASMASVLSVVDGTKVPPEAMAAVKNFSSLTCGNEAGYSLPNGSPWPAGSILGMAAYQSPASQQGAQSVTLNVLKCVGNDVDPAGNPVVVSPGEKFYLAASMQTPARGQWAQAGHTAASANGYVDAANTMRVIPDPQALPQVLQQLLGGLQPSCTDCEFAPEVVIDVKPGDAANSINPSSQGVIPVALFGSDRFNVEDVNRGSLRLGELVPRPGKDGKVQCAVSDVNLDTLPDLVCQFQNKAGNWTTGQTLVTLTGKLNNNESIFASDKVQVLR